MRVTNLIHVAIAALTLAACGAGSIHSEDARQELRDCRRVGDIAACQDLGERYADGDEVDRDLERAAELFSRACLDSRRDGCHNLAQLGLHTEAEFLVDDIVRDLERSCRRYNVAACDSLIVLLENEDGPAYDPDYGQRIRDRLCADDFDYWCFTDTDNDGIDDNEDACPDEPEDADLFEDEDGCPDPDNDDDGVLDGDDACPLIAEDDDGFEDEDGCIDFDNDGDQILDEGDDCPDIAEDFDGFEDEDGCIDFDNDGDGILDDADDCPDTAEDYDGFEDRDGCPEEGEGLIALTCEAIEINEDVYFDTGSDVILERSHPLLDQVADVLQSVSYVRLVEVAGHTDDRGDAEDNRVLSDARAASVRNYLVAAGVDPARLQAVGYGEEFPVADNGTSAGRAANRRVEFNIVEQDSACQ